MEISKEISESSNCFSKANNVPYRVGENLEHMIHQGQVILENNNKIVDDFDQLIPEEEIKYDVDDEIKYDIDDIKYSPPSLMTNSSSTASAGVTNGLGIIHQEDLSDYYPVYNVLGENEVQSTINPYSVPTSTTQPFGRQVFDQPSHYFERPYSTDPDIKNYNLGSDETNYIFPNEMNPTVPMYNEEALPHSNALDNLGQSMYFPTETSTSLSNEESSNGMYTPKPSTNSHLVGQLSRKELRAQKKKLEKDMLITNPENDVVVVEPHIEVSENTKLKQNFGKGNHKLKCTYSYCGYSTNRWSNFLRHNYGMHQQVISSNKQNNPKILPTFCCGHDFQFKARLALHRQEVHQDGYQCNLCSKRFKRKTLLNRHILLHTDPKSEKCPYCDYATSHSFNLKRHITARHQKSSTITSETPNK